MKKIFWRGQTQEIVVEVYDNYKQWFNILKSYNYTDKEILSELEYRM